MAKGFKEENKDLIDGLIRTGMKRKTAVVLSYLFSNEECTQSEIEKKTKLRQPEVSMAINDIRSNGWLEKREVKKEGKGRPYHVYSLDDSVDVIDAISEREEEKIEGIKKNMDEMKHILKKLEKKKG